MTFQGRRGSRVPAASAGLKIALMGVLAGLGISRSDNASGMAMAQVCHGTTGYVMGHEQPVIRCEWVNIGGGGGGSPSFEPGGRGGGGGATQPSKGAQEQDTPSKLNQASTCGEVSGNPVVLSTGNKVEPESDFSSAGEMALSLQRTYNAYWSARGLFGTHWLSNYDYTLVLSGTILWAQRPDGRRLKLVFDGTSGRYIEAKSGPIAYAAKESDGSFTLYNEDNGVERYNAQGYVTELRNEQGVRWSFRYDGAYLQEVTHSSGRSVKFAWSDGVVTQVTDPAGNVYRYTYTPNIHGQGVGAGRLASAVLPGAPATTVAYHYEDSRFIGGLTGKSFNGVRYSTFTYDDQGRATSTAHAGGVEHYAFAYSVEASTPVAPPPAPVPPGGARAGGGQGWCPGEELKGQGLRMCPRQVSVSALAAGTQAAADAAQTIQLPTRMSVTETTPLGRKTTYLYVDGKLTETSGQATAHCPASYKEKTYDANGYEDVVSDFADNLTDFDYDAQGHLLKKAEARGTSAERVTTYTWDLAHNRMLTESVQGDHQTRYEYTSDGRIAKQTVVDLTTHGQGRTQVTTYTYGKQANGLISQLVVDGPLPGTGDATTYAFSSTGDLASTTNGLGHRTVYAGYNGLGLPGTVTDANGAAVTFKYDARGRVLQQIQQVNAAPQITVTTYDGAGLTASVKTPDGLTRQYRYDAARRLVTEDAATSKGHQLKRYHYNAASQVTQVEVLHVQ